MSGITDSQIRIAITEEKMNNSDVSNDFEVDKASIEEVRHHLARVQEAVFESLGTFVRKSALEKYPISIIEETHWSYHFGVPASLWESLPTPFNGILQRLHEMATNYDDLPNGADTVLIVHKSSDWIAAEQAYDQRQTSLMRDGMTPAEAVDYDAIDRGWSVSDWSVERGVHKQSVEGNIDRADSKHGRGQPPYPEKELPQELMATTYWGTKQELPNQDTSKKRVFCDGARLPPRTDIVNASVRGDFEWGYNGAGPTQLAVALLAHAVGDDAAAKHHRAMQNEYTSDWEDDWAISSREIKNFVDSLQ